MEIEIEPPNNENSKPNSSEVEFGFGLTDKIPIFNYLIAHERVAWYRTIMRVFLSRHREIYKYQLTALEIWEAVRQEYDPHYTQEKCQTDLKALEDWGNLITTYDASRHTSIQSFRAPALLYQATPLAIAVETFLEQQRRVGGTLGALRQGDLPRLWEMLGKINLWLTPNSELNAPNRLEIAEEWRRAFELFTTMAQEAAQYLANMSSAGHRPRASLESFQSYKRAVVEYVTNFGQALANYSLSFRELMAGWLAGGQTQILVEAIADYLEPPTLEDEYRRPFPQLLQEAGRQIQALTTWFSVGENADKFRRAAAVEVEKVVRRAEQFATAARPNASYAADLDALARRMMEAVNPEETSQLTLLAFGFGQPAHFPESLTSPTSSTGLKSSWDELATVKPILRVIGRARFDRTPELAISDNRAAQQALIEQRTREREAERARFAALFATGSLEVGEVWLASPADRNALLLVVRGCLRDTKFRYRAPDGSFIQLVNPREKRYGLLRAPDGSLLMPRYRLERVEK